MRQLDAAGVGADPSAQQTERNELLMRRWRQPALSIHQVRQRGGRAQRARANTRGDAHTQVACTNVAVDDERDAAHAHAHADVELDAPHAHAHSDAGHAELDDGAAATTAPTAPTNWASTIAPVATAHISVRFVPNQSADDIVESVRAAPAVRSVRSR